MQLVLLFILCHKRLNTIVFDWLQFDRRSVTPNTLENRIREFHYKYGGTDEELDRLPVMKNHRDLWVLLLKYSLSFHKSNAN